MEEITTTDLSKFGYRGKGMAAVLLTELSNGNLPKDFYDDEIAVMMNMSSGNVFLTNSDCEVAMMNGDKLESFYTCPQCGYEGFAEDMQHEDDELACQKYLEQIGVIDEQE